MILRNGLISGKPALLTNTATATITAAQMNHQTHVLTAACDLTLPMATVGLDAIFYANSDFEFAVVPGTADYCILNGTTLKIAQGVVSDGKAFSCVRARCLVSGYWTMTTLRGTISANSTKHFIYFSGRPISFEQAMALFKVGKTAFNLPTVVRNTVSNVLQLNMSGVPIYDIPGYMIGAGRVLLEKGKTWKEMQRRGLFKTNWAAAEINEVLGAVRKWEKGGNVLADAVDFGKDIAKYYGKIDDFFKAAKYLEQIKMGASPETAAIEAHKWGMDYSMAHPAIKWSRRHLTPFISYQYKIAPLIAESIAKRPWVIAKYAMVPLLMEEAARRSMNLTEQDFQKLKKDLPLFIKKAGSYVVLPWKSKTGEAQWTNLEYFLPWQNFMAIKRDVQEGNYGEVASKDVGFGGPFIDIGVMLKSLHGDNPPKDPFTGRDVYNKLDTPTNKALALSRWLYERWAPQMFTEFGALGAARKAITGEKDRYGRQVSPENAALKMVGVNVVSPTKAQTNIEKAALAKDLRASLIRIVSDPTRDKTEKAAAMEDYKQRTRALMER